MVSLAWGTGLAALFGFLSGGLRLLGARLLDLPWLYGA